MVSVSAENITEEVAQLTLKRFSECGLKGDQLAISLKVVGKGAIASSDYRGDELIYPASIVKLFYLVAAHRWLQDHRIEPSDELMRAMRDMIVDSSDDATHYVIDILTGTTSGPELPDGEMLAWQEKRNVINEYFRAQGYERINVNQKPWADGPYGRERVFVGADKKNRNLLTTNATARLLTEIVLTGSVSPTRSEQMMSLLARDYQKASDDPDDQATCYSGRALTAGCRLWSKAGWTSTTRHDAAYIELPSGKRIVLVTFTVNHAKQYEIIPFVVWEVVKRL
jgi:beta-lactamase class A